MSSSSFEVQEDSGDPRLSVIEELIRSRRAAEALEQASLLRLTDRRHAAELERLRAQAHYILGDEQAALVHLLRALRRSGRDARALVRIRSNLAEVLLRLGQDSRAQRELQRALAEVHAHDLGVEQIPWLLNALALVHRRRGMLSFAIHTYEEALELARDPTRPVRGWGAIANNLALACLHWGDRDRAGELLHELESADEHSLPPGHRVGFHLTRALFFLDGRQEDECRAALEAAMRLVDPSDLRAQVLCRGFQAELESTRGHPSQAISLLEELLTLTREQKTLRDLLPGVARRLSEAYLRDGRRREALERARLSVASGKGWDVQEWAAGLRVMGECLLALAREREARAAFGEALSVLQATECHAERARLEQARAHDAGPTRVAPPAPVRPSRSHSEAETELALRDGRRFLTADHELVAQIRAAASDRLPVLLVGETGTGKELVAHLVHELGDTRGRPFVVVDCATLPESIAEAELFGAARGAYSGAVADRAGLVSEAEGGTLFLDELPELSLAGQGKLLRLLQDGTYRRVGESRVRKVSARIVAATNRDPEALQSAGLLKADLYYRLRGHTILLKPLRERPSDIRLIASRRSTEARLAGVTEGAMSRLLRHPWPGNVRELEMLVRVWGSIAGRGAWLDESAVASLGKPTPAAADGSFDLRTARLEAERDGLRRLLNRHEGNVAAAARDLSMSRQGLYKALHRTGLI